MKSKILMVVGILFGLFFINSGVNVFTQHMPMPENVPQEMMDLMGAFMKIGWLMPTMAVTQIIGGLMCLSNKYRAFGALILLPMILGILLTHLTSPIPGLPMSLVLFAIELWIIIESREKYMPLIK